MVVHQIASSLFSKKNQKKLDSYLTSALSFVLMKEYSVKELTKLAGVSIRTLHHYDQIGLLKPSRRSEKNYRFYGKDELLLLQQILFFKELGIELKAIKQIIHAEDFNLLEALESHKQGLKKQQQKLKTLLITLDKTIKDLKTTETMLTDKELYRGFSEEEIKSIRTEVKGRWGEKLLLETENRIRALSQTAWNSQKEKEEATNKLLGELMDLEPGHELVQKAVGQHHQNLNTYYEVDENRYRGLAEMYTQDDRFRAYYDKYQIGLADFLKEAIHIYCDMNFS